MRDIRKDLRERLETVTADRTKLEAQLAMLRASEAGIKALLQEEERLFSNISVPLFPDSGAGLAQLIVQAMKTKNRPLDLQEIKDEIRKTPYNFGEKAPGRAIHFALVGLDQGGSVQRLTDKRWVIKQDNGIPVQERTN